MKKAPLQKSLRDLVSGFGYENVRKALRGMQPEKAAALNRHPKTGHATADASSTKPGKKRTKPNALAIVKSFDLTNDEKNKLLFILAEKYEAKEFMPGVNHVRGFLARYGNRRCADKIAAAGHRHCVQSTGRFGYG